MVSAASAPYCVLFGRLDTLNLSPSGHVLTVPTETWITLHLPSPYITMYYLSAETEPQGDLPSKMLHASYNARLASTPSRSQPHMHNNSCKGSGNRRQKQNCMVYSPLSMITGAVTGILCLRTPLASRTGHTRATATLTTADWESTQQVISCAKNDISWLGNRSPKEACLACAATRNYGTRMLW